MSKSDFPIFPLAVYYLSPEDEESLTNRVKLLPSSHTRGDQ